VAIYLVRHAHAGTRGGYDGPDAERPLTEKGHGQAAAIAQALYPAAPVEIRSSPAVRCLQTVAPLARRSGVEVLVDAGALAEGSPVDATTALIWRLAVARTDAVLCSHGDVIPAALHALRGDGVDVDDGPGLPKGTYYRLDVTPDGRITSATFAVP